LTYKRRPTRAKSLAVGGASPITQRKSGVGRMSVIIAEIIRVVEVYRIWEALSNQPDTKAPQTQKSMFPELSGAEVENS